MGTYLSTPVTEKCDEFGESLKTSVTDEDVSVDWGVVDMQGWRKSMEDAHTAVTNVPLSVLVSNSDGNENQKQQPQKLRNARVFGVYDGHGGAEVARFCQYYFVSVLTNQPTWVEHNNSNTDNNTNTNTNAIGLPLRLPLAGDDDRVPSPPPPPSSSTTQDQNGATYTDIDVDIYDGNGNEDGYRLHHLPKAVETPVGKSLREAFHAMDRMINDPSRRNEISALRSQKTAKGETKILEEGFKSIPVIVPMSMGPSPPDFYITQKQAQLSRMSTSTLIVDDAIVIDADAAAVDNTNTNTDTNTDERAAAAALAYGIEEATVEKEQQQAQADKSLSTVLSPEQAEAVKREIEEFEKNSSDNSSSTSSKDDDKDDDSNDVVGLEEAAALDSNIEEDDDDRADDGSSADDSGGAVITPSAAAPPSAATATHPDPIIPGGKVTTMLQKILSLGVGAATKRADTALPEDDGNDDAYDPDVSALLPATTTTINQGPNDTPTPSTVEYPNSSEVTRTDVHHPSVIHNGRLACNLPDHPIHAGATAVVAVITGQILTVANAGDSRAVLCRRRHNSSNSNSSTTTDEVGHFAFPLSYDHKPSQTHEMDRILLGGGFVNHFGRINGNLNLSRSIGDLKYKQVPGIPPYDQMITAEPDIMQIVLKDDDEFIILGCDGIWDCLSNEQAVNFVKSRIDTKTPTEIGAEMLDEIVSDDPRITQGIGGDNMTIMIIDLQSSKRTRKGGGGNTTTTTTTTNDNDNDTTTTPSSNNNDNDNDNVDSTMENDVFKTSEAASE